MPWLADLRDPWAIGDLTIRLRPKKWEYRAEAAMLRSADAIVANTPRFSELLADAYPNQRGKIASITNGYDQENFESNPVPPLASPTVKLIHTGLIYANRDPAPFLEAVRQINAEPNCGKLLRTRFLGNFTDDAHKNRIQDVIQAWGLRDVVSLEGQVPYARSLTEMSRSDILVLLDSPGRKAGVPAKLYEYIGAGRPILALAEADSDVSWVLSQCGLPYRLVPPGEPEQIRRALLDLIFDPVTRAAAHPGQPLSRFTRESLAGELAQLLDACVEGKSSATSRSGSELEPVR
jgi:glycosyltransferase involved in cell wall biosynthesis